MYYGPCPYVLEKNLLAKPKHSSYASCVLNHHRELSELLQQVITTVTVQDTSVLNGISKNHEDPVPGGLQQVALQSACAAVTLR